MNSQTNQDKTEHPKKEYQDIWELGNKILVFAGGGAFLGGLIGAD